MTATACNNKWSGFFSVGEDFDDADLLEADWTNTSEPSSASRSSTGPTSAPPQESTTFHSHNVHQDSSSVSASSREGSSEPGSVKGLRSLSRPNSSSPAPSAPHKPTASLRAPLGGSSVVSFLQPPSEQSNPPPSSDLPQDDFDEWDVDLEELDEGLLQNQPASATGTDSISPAKPAEDTPVVSSLRGFCSTVPTPRTPRSVIRPPCPSTFTPQAPPQSTCQSYVRFSSPRPVRASPELQRGVVTPRAPQRRPESLFQAVSPAPSQTRTPRPLHTPVLTNHLVQLVSAANKTPQRPRRDTVRSKTRRFPGPAGALPQQTNGRNLDDIVVTVPQMPAHGAVARLRNEIPNSQGSEEEEFSGGPWAAMKIEMGLDERNSSCFLHSYSIVMVLRKAALRQLVRNKVPNMAVVLKSILHTHADAKAVFRDPTGEMQGTVHRRLLEDRQGELKPGVVLLLKQVGVFSPSNRNHYLNVTPNNLLKIYSSEGAFNAPSQLLQSALDVEWQRHGSSRPVAGPVCQMELHLNDEEEEQSTKLANPAAPASVIQPAETEVSEEALWGADDLDELLGELPV